MTVEELSITPVIESRMSSSDQLALERLHRIGFIHDRAGFLSEWLTVIHNPTTSGDRFIEACLPLRNINRGTAYRILAFLPEPLRHGSNIAPDVTEEHIKFLHTHFIGISSWLLTFEYDRLEVKDVLDRLFPDYGVRARVSELRYQMIRELIMKGDLWDLFTKPGLPWLLCEAAICRQQLEKLGIPLSKRRHYNARSKESDTFTAYVQGETVSLNPASVEVGFQEYVANFEKHVTALAIERAKCDRSFDRLYFSPYMKAVKHWDRTQLEPEWKLITPVEQRQRQRKPNVKK